MRVIATRELPITREDDVVEIRRTVREIAQERGFDAFATAAITTATSELTRNAWLHGGGGHAEIAELEDEGRYGIRIVFVDQGPGIADMERAMAGGYSTRRSLGLGLSGSQRLVDEFDVVSSPGGGTRITITKWTRYRAGLR